MELQPAKAYLITVGADINEIFRENGETFELEDAQAQVQGDIESGQLPKGQIMIANEEGKFDKEYNPIATGIADLHRALWSGDYICGNVVICPSPMLP